MSNIIPEPAHEPVAKQGERVEAETQLGTVEARVDHIDIEADVTGPRYRYTLSSGLQVFDDALEC